MLTTNNWFLEALSEAGRNWIEENCVAVYVPEPVWQNFAILAPAPSVAKKRSSTMRTPVGSPEHKRSHSVS